MQAPIGHISAIFCGGYVMSVRVASAALAGLFLSVAALSAQQLNGPVNLPPAGFTGDQYVDNAGCAFARAGVSGNTIWVARVNMQRQQICGLAPTFGATAVAAAPARPAAEDPGMPIPTVASTVPAAPRPAAAPATAPRPAPAADAPRGYTLAEACEGRTGVQPGLINTRTGLPINCGGTTPVAAAAPVATAPAAPAPRTLTLAEACAEQAARGVTLINATTGSPVDCPAATLVASAPPPATRPAPAYTTATVAATVAAQTRLDPLSAATLSGNVAPTASVRPVQVGDVLSAETISGVVTQIHYGPPPGYEPVWTDGRLNPNRGLPEIQAQVPVAAAPAMARVSTMSAPQPQAVATGGFVQVGIFGDPANAARAESTLRGLGLPVAVSTVNRDGRALQVVAAGPIAAADLSAALGAARAAGYGDAYIR
jgi:hypothetical protein